MISSCVRTEFPAQTLLRMQTTSKNASSDFVAFRIRINSCLRVRGICRKSTRAVFLHAALFLLFLGTGGAGLRTKSGGKRRANPATNKSYSNVFNGCSIQTTVY